MNRAVFLSRRTRVQELLDFWQVDALLIDAPIDLFYLTGHSVSSGLLCISKKEVIFVVDGRYYSACSDIEKVTLVLCEKGPFSGVLLQHIHHCKSIGFDQNAISYKTFQEYQLFFSKEKLQVLQKPILSLRERKDKEELDAIRKSSALCSLGFDHVVKGIKLGCSELDLARRLKIFWIEHGAEAFSFDPIIAFGINTALPHYRAGTTRLKKHDPILIDIGVSLDKYCSDMTRMVFFGTPSSEIAKITHIVEEAQKRAIHFCKEGVLCADLDQVARKHIVEAGYGDAFMHSLGHGVGLEVHEEPLISSKKEGVSKKLVKDSVITIEPGIYLPGRGGCRIEDMLIVGKDASEDLTQRPRHPIILDAGN